MKKAAFHNLGCKVNAWETEAMEQLLEASGYEIVPFAEGADAYIINTCSVTNIADKKSRQMLHRARKMNPTAVVVAVGCYVQSAGETLRKDPAVDIIVGNDRKGDLPRILDRWFAEGAGTAAVTKMQDIQKFEPLHIHRTNDHTRAFMKVQDGCNQFCSYCIIPYTRGRIRSRRPGDVLREARELAAAGYRELVLTGIHLSSYGLDMKDALEGAGGVGMRLIDLMEMLEQVPGLERIRLGSLEPRIVTEEFARRLSALNKVCPHFHLSLQSGCDATLRRMNRHYTTEEYRESCGLLRRYFDQPAITTDVIVGFPGETPEEFEATRAFLEEIGFYEMHVFRYSRRQGTRADRMTDQIPETVKEERSRILLELADRMSASYRERFLGEEETVILEEPLTVDGKRYMAGYTSRYVRCAVPWQDGLRGETARGRLMGQLPNGVLLMTSTVR